MYSKEQLEGILLSIAKPEVHVGRANNTNLGYRVRIRVNIRGGAEFLVGVQRSLAQQGINCNFKDKEHKSRPRPIVSIGSIVDLWKLCEFVPKKPDAKGVWKGFRKIVKLIDNGEHHTLEGFEKILEIKGEL